MRITIDQKYSNAQSVLNVSDPSEARYWAKRAVELMPGCRVFTAEAAVIAPDVAPFKRVGLGRKVAVR